MSSGYYYKIGVIVRVEFFQCRRKILTINSVGTLIFCLGCKLFSVFYNDHLTSDHLTHLYKCDTCMSGSTDYYLAYITYMLHIYSVTCYFRYTGLCYILYFIKIVFKKTCFRAYPNKFTLSYNRLAAVVFIA